MNDLLSLQDLFNKKIFRIPFKTDPRIFTKVARNSKKWRRLYKKEQALKE